MWSEELSIDKNDLPAVVNTLQKGRSQQVGLAYIYVHGKNRVYVSLQGGARNRVNVSLQMSKVRNQNKIQKDT